MRLNSGDYSRGVVESPSLEEMLHKNHHFIQQVTDTSRNILYIYDLAEQKNVYINLAITTVLGHHAETLSQAGSSFLFSLLHPDDVKKLAEHQQRLYTARDNETFEIEYRLQRADGEWCWLSSRDTIFSRNQDGSPRQILGTAKEINHHKQIEEELRQQTERERLVSRIAERIHQSLDLQEILNTTVADVRQFLQTDRVIIYRFESNWSGIVAVESVGEGWLSLLGTAIKDPCFEKPSVNNHGRGRIQAVEDIQTAGLAECYVELLTQYQVRANLVLPITHEDRVWGLLIAHHCRAPRHWQSLEIELLHGLATQVAIAIQQSELYHRVQQLNTDLERQVRERTQQFQQSLTFADVLKRITDRIRDSLDEQQILQTAVQEVVSVLKVDYCCAALYDPEHTTATVQYEFTHADLGSGIGQVLLVADTPKVHDRLLKGEFFESYECERTGYLASAETGDMACPDLFDRFAAKLLCPIFLDPASCQPGWDSLEQSTCGIKPGAIGYLAVIDQTYHVFSDTEIKLVNQVANQCAIAIRQARLYQASQAQVKALERLNHLKDDFLSTVSHELRTPVASMKMAIQMLELSLKQEAQPPSEKTSRYLQILYHQCEREIGLITDLLDLQRLEAGIQPLNPTRITLQLWIPQRVILFQELAKNRQQTLQIEISPEIPTLTCDAPSLERILVELLNNACKYSPPGSTLHFKVWAEAAKICLSVSNTGVKIPVEEISAIFDKFHRVPNTDPWKQGGTGLGLALVQKLVNHLSGSIRVESTAEQTCFTVELPLT
ncbi:GAF domain-containing protein [Kovacikia minuta CCNUW1]|uniref:GAF domain-containing protein n=1 Tax=Kovacikia minuta TaxID=2931930 RepID=UPI001CCE6A19|nr:GAF domain-containing protein [Kovacikia minuta]UBF25918.1 GAF domain-containing protein [Kovacikia minuta CCNUW1]